jgi:hypothetical protein
MKKIFVVIMSEDNCESKLMVIQIQHSVLFRKRWISDNMNYIYGKILEANKRK